MKEDVIHFIKHPCPFVTHKKPHIQGKAPFQPITSSAPLEIVGIDFVHLEKSNGGF